MGINALIGIESIPSSANTLWKYVDCFLWNRNSSQTFPGNMLTVFHEIAIQVKHSEEIYWPYSMKSQFKSSTLRKYVDCFPWNHNSSQTIWGKVWSYAAMRNRNTSCNAWRASRSKNAIGILEHHKIQVSHMFDLDFVRATQYLSSQVKECLKVFGSVK